MTPTCALCGPLQKDRSHQEVMDYWCSLALGKDLGLKPKLSESPIQSSSILWYFSETISFLSGCFPTSFELYPILMIEIKSIGKMEQARSHFRYVFYFSGKASNYSKVKFLALKERFPSALPVHNSLLKYTKKLKDHLPPKNQNN